tara:strand:- start:29 stop:310 length:282 start_codon:yes stop_codon:yes gene_type:complete
MGKGTKLERKVKMLRINPASKSDLLKYGFTVENLTKEKPVPLPASSFDHIKRKKGGSVKKKKKFPDLSGDGKITKKDILMAKGVIKKTKKRKK